MANIIYDYRFYQHVNGIYNSPVQTRRGRKLIKNEKARNVFDTILNNLIAKHHIYWYVQKVECVNTPWPKRVLVSIPTINLNSNSIGSIIHVYT